MRRLDCRRRQQGSFHPVQAHLTRYRKSSSPSLNVMAACLGGHGEHFFCRRQHARRNQNHRRVRAERRRRRHHRLNTLPEPPWFRGFVATDSANASGRPEFPDFGGGWPYLRTDCPWGRVLRENRSALISSVRSDQVGTRGVPRSRANAGRSPCRSAHERRDVTMRTYVRFAGCGGVFGCGATPRRACARAGGSSRRGAVMNPAGGPA